MSHPTDAISLRLRGAQAWVRHDEYSRPELPGYVRDSAPFEAADMLELQQREIAGLKAALKDAALVRARALEDAAKIVDAAQPMGKIAATAAAIRALKGALAQETAMNDRELLTFAAAAEGHPYPWVLPERGGERPWNPLQDDGDALRLALMVGLSFEPYPLYSTEKHSVIVKQRRRSDQLRESNPTECIERYQGDPMGATRRAIVRAAAALAGATGAGGE